MLIMEKLQNAELFKYSSSTSIPHCMPGSMTTQQSEIRLDRPPNRETSSLKEKKNEQYVSSFFTSTHISHSYKFIIIAEYI
jgi:hypothetical protein